MDDLNSCRCEGCLRGIVEDLEAELARVRDRLGEARLRLELADAGFALAHREPAQDDEGDIVALLLECAADSRATEGDYYADQFSVGAEIFEQAAAEIARLRLTDEEREAVERGYCSLAGVEDTSAHCSRWDAEAAATLRGLLERLS